MKRIALVVLPLVVLVALFAVFALSLNRDPGLIPSVLILALSTLPPIAKVKPLAATLSRRTDNGIKPCVNACRSTARSLPNAISRNFLVKNPGSRKTRITSSPNALSKRLRPISKLSPLKS